MAFIAIDLVHAGTVVYHDAVHNWSDDTQTLRVGARIKIARNPLVISIKKPGQWPGLSVLH